MKKGTRTQIMVSVEASRVRWFDGWGRGGDGGRPGPLRSAGERYRNDPSKRRLFERPFPRTFPGTAERLFFTAIGARKAARPS